MQAVVTTVVFNVLAFVFILIRCVSRFVIIKQAGTEDYLIIFAFVLSVGLTATIVLREYNAKNLDTQQLTVVAQKRSTAWVDMQILSVKKTTRR